MCPFFRRLPVCPDGAWVSGHIFALGVRAMRNSGTQHGPRLACGLLAGLGLVLAGSAAARVQAQPPAPPGAPAAPKAAPAPPMRAVPAADPAVAQPPAGGQKAPDLENNIPKGPNDRLVVPSLSPQDPTPRINGADLSAGAGKGLAKDPPGVPPVWVLHMKFKDPRFVKVKVPGKGERLCMYVWYQVYNFTGEPRLFIPSFELKADTATWCTRTRYCPPWSRRSSGRRTHRVWTTSRTR